ncbi:venom serine carboxypeptidase-like [Coccinella septempunctata]|uniref:venom serine carboxypeptidase-like n=1 Tax=Coccinella septempunctata TaxID=41139 RepID=UPI001D07821A|nr:venom serine carboxypeptidase-like [Coccinella septempunctata]
MTCSTLYLLSLCVLFQLSTSVSRFPNFYRKIQTRPVKADEDNGQPLILTPYIEAGRIQEARNASRVTHKAFGNITHYTGFFTVNKTHNTNLFAWFCPSESDPANDPVVLWLQGGPGSTSLFGLFSENGPFRMNNTRDVVLRKETWTKKHNMIWIDNPAGAGYSFTDAEGLAHDEDQVSAELFQAIQQFFQLFPELRKNDFFITGESYGGHYIPSISHYILRANRGLPERLKVNLKGLAIGNGWTDPINQLNYGDYLYQHGIVDLKTKDFLNTIRDDSIDLIKQGRYAEARDRQDEILYTMMSMTGITNVYNYLFAQDQDDEPLMDTFIQTSEIRKAIHVGNAKFQDGGDVNEALNSDVMKSVVHLLPELIDNYRVLLYSGQVDIIVAYPLTVNYLEKLNFSSSAEYKMASRNIWSVNNDIAGFVKVAGNLTDLLVRDAGHMVPHDQPVWSLDLIYRFTRNLKFDEEYD